MAWQNKCNWCLIKGKENGIVEKINAFERKVKITKAKRTKNKIIEETNKT